MNYKKIIFTFFLTILITLNVEGRYIQLSELKNGEKEFDSNQLRFMLEKGELCLIESDEKDNTFKQVIVFSLFNASLEKVFEVVSHPEKYPSFIKKVVKSNIISKEGNSITYEYELEIPLFNVVGVNQMILSPPNNIYIFPLKGDIKSGAWRWQFISTPDDKTIVLLYQYYDVKEMSWFMKKLVKSQQYLEHGAGVGSALVAVKAIKDRVEGKREENKGIEKYSFKKREKIEIEKIDFNSEDKLKPIIYLLTRGILSFIESYPDGSLKQILIIDKAEVSKDKIFNVVKDVEKYPEFTKNVEKIKIVKKESENVWVCEEYLKVPLISFIIRQKVICTPYDTIDITPDGGDITKAHWFWEFLDLEINRSLISYYYYVDLGEGSWLIKKFMEMDPAMEHGMNISWGVVVLKILKERAENLYN